MPDGQREVYANYILLCSNCHSRVDANPDDWPVELLDQVKRKHEARVAALSEKLNVLDGHVSVSVDEADDVAGVRINRPTRIQPGFREDVTVKQGRRVTGIEIGGPDEPDER